MTYVEDYVNRLKQIQGASVAGMASQLANRPVNRSEFANLILQRARSDFSVAQPQMPQEQKKGIGSKAKSVALGVLDILARPGYAAAEASQQAFNTGHNAGDVAKGAWEGFSGKKQTSFIDVLQQQYKDDVRQSPEYKQLLKDSPNIAEQYALDKEKASQTNPKAIVGGLLADFTLDPLNLIGGGAVKKPIQAIRDLKNAGKEGQAVADIAATAAKAPESGVVQGAESAPVTPAIIGNIGTIKPTEGIKPSTFADVLKNKTALQEFPSVQGKFGSNRRPPSKMLDGKFVKADYQNEISQTIQGTPRFAHITDVHNRDIRASDFAKLQKARVVDETAQVVDQTAKGNPAALDLLTNKGIRPLSPVARGHTDAAVNHIIKEINNSIADPVKAKAAGKQPRHPVFNAPTQNNLSNKLTNAARSQLKTESGVPGISGPAAPKFVPAVFSRYMDMLKNAEESLITHGRSTLNDAYYPRGGIKPDSPYLRLSDVLDALPTEVAQRAILGPNQSDKVLPSIILKAITGNNTALGKVAKHPELFNAIKAVDWTPLMVKEYATRTIDAANAAHKTTEDVAKFISDAVGQTSSDAAKAGIIDATVTAGKKEFSKQMPEAKASVNDMLDGLRKSIPHPMPNIVDDIINRGKHKLASGVFDAGKGAKEAQAPRIETVAAHTDEALADTGQTIQNAAFDMAAADKAAEYGIFSSVLGWVKPNAGYKELRPLVLENIGVRRASATTRASEIIKIFGKIPEAEHMAFWHEVRGFIDPVAGSHVEPVQQMQKMLGNMFGESGLAAKFAGNTSIARAGLNIDHLNKHMRIVGIKDFKFIREVPDPLNPGKVVHLDGPQILSTWKNYIPKNSADLRIFTHNLTQAVENAMVEYSAFSQLGAMYGKKAPATGHVMVAGMHPAIDGMHFPTEIAPQIGKMARGIDEMFMPLAGSSLMRALDQGLRTWKTGVTIYAPSHHIRNMVGDMFMSWLDGLSNPMYYTKSGAMLKANHHRYSDIKTGKNPLNDLLGDTRKADVIGQIMGQTKQSIPKGTRVIATAKIGKKKYQITIDQAYQMMFRQGLLPHSGVIEDLPGTETLAESLANRFHPGKAGLFQPFKGAVGSKVRGMSETREHFVRGAHYLYKLENTKANSLDDLFNKAAEAVRKYHPDGIDLTLTEKRVFRRIFPFYSWTRKAIPLVLEGLVMNPAKILAYPKLMSGIQESQGIDSSISDPWPDNQLFPDWLSSSIIGPVIKPDSAFAQAIARSQNEVGYGIVDPGLPSNDILEQFGNNPIKGAGNMVTPFIKIPAELAFGREYQTGAPIKDKTQYLDKNIPLLSTISRLTNGAAGTGVVEGGQLKNKETQPYNPSAIINFLTGAGILDTGRYIKGGQFDLKARLAKEQANGPK